MTSSEMKHRPDLNNRTTFLPWLIAAILTGIAIAWIDTRPSWDDTGITVLLLLSFAVLFGFAAKQRPWLIALALTIWVPLADIGLFHNFSSLFAFFPGLAGSYAGFFIHRTFFFTGKP